MWKVRTKKLPENCVVLTPIAYRQLMALAAESHRDPEELLTIAVAIFARSVQNLVIMHQPPGTDKPLLPAARAAAIEKARPKDSPPVRAAQKQRLPVTPIGGIVKRNLKEIKREQCRRREESERK
jgi:hypothetical protein